MNNTIKLTSEQIKDLQSGKSITIKPSITIEPPKPVIAKWEPKGGPYPVKPLLTQFCPKNMIVHQETISGLRYDNKTQAEQAAKALRSYARQLAWVSEHYPDYNISEKSYETDLILATLPNNIAYHLINEIQKGNVSL